MNQINYGPIPFRNNQQDERFLPFLAGVALSAPLFLAAGRPCVNCVVPMPVYPPQPFPPFPYPTPYPAPYPTPYPYPVQQTAPEVEYNIYGPGYPGGNIPYQTPGIPGGTNAPYVSPQFSATASVGTNLR